EIPAAFDAPKYSFTVQMVWRPKPLSVRYEEKLKAEAEAAAAAAEAAAAEDSEATDADAT
ncbi:MAG: hypothetical protein R3C53_26520, partial [Pirellulaceae bacterium]